MTSIVATSCPMLEVAREVVLAGYTCKKALVGYGSDEGSPMLKSGGRQQKEKKRAECRERVLVTHTYFGDSREPLL